MVFLFGSLLINWGKSEKTNIEVDERRLKSCRLFIFAEMYKITESGKEMLYAVYDASLEVNNQAVCKYQARAYEEPLQNCIVIRCQNNNVPCFKGRRK